MFSVYSELPGIPKYPDLPYSMTFVLSTLHRMGVSYLVGGVSLLHG